MVGARRRIAGLTGVVLAGVILAGCSQQAASGGARATRTSLPPPTATVAPTATPTPAPVSWLHNTTLLTIYGRGFNNTPILGRLGMDGSFAAMRRQIQPFLAGIRANNGGKRVRVAVHLIYALATPCSDEPNCLYYLDDAGVNIVRDYIQPAQRLGWLVILDDQLGRSTPRAEVQRMLDSGYLRYDNVGVALDPEFRTLPGQATPGIPIGAVTARELNQAAGLLNHYAFSAHLRHHKIMLVHQFQVPMIQDRQALRWWPRGDVDPVIVADGFGDPGTKGKVYHTLLGPTFRRIRYRGIKLFYPNPYETAGHGDNPLLTWQQVFGRALTYYGSRPYRIWPQPSVVVIA